MLNKKRLLVISILMISLIALVGCSSSNIGESLDDALSGGGNLKVILDYAEQDIYNASNDSLLFEVEVVNENDLEDTREMNFKDKSSFEIRGLESNQTYDIVVRAKDESNNLLYEGEGSVILSDVDTNTTILLEGSENLQYIWGNNIVFSSTGTTDIYYKTDWANANIHYRLDDGTWTNLPGVAMEDSAYEGYKVATIDSGDASYIEAAFNNGDGVWDNNNDNNYIFNESVSTLEDGEIKSGTPEGEDSGEYQATIYYRTEWADANIHYRVNGGTWTDAPGVAMADSTYEGYKVATVNSNEPIDNVEAVFNDNNGIWDNNDSNNYLFTYEVSTLEGSEIKSGTPEGEEEDEVLDLWTVYYRTEWSNPHFHYGIDDLGWTDVPGVEMEESSYPGYAAIIIESDQEINRVEGVFNDGGEQWDNNDSNNYILTEPVSTVEDGVIRSGAPEADDGDDGEEGNDDDDDDVPLYEGEPNVPSNLVNNTMYQVFYWDSYPGLWSDIANGVNEYVDAEHLANTGITSMWLPPAAKASSGTDDVGYAVYDFWDLGEFDQHGAVETRYGTRAELESAIARLDVLGISSYFDVVFNHRMGGAPETAPVWSGDTIESYTDMTLLGRSAHYSNAHNWNWNWEEFNAVDWCAEDGEIGVTYFDGKYEDNSYGQQYLMGNDVDYSQEHVRHEMNEWGEWIINEVGFAGFRMDAIAHVDSDFTNQWLNHVQWNTEEDIFFVAEAWVGDVGDYLNHVGNDYLMAFDFALRNEFVDLSSGDKDLRWWGGLVNSDRASQAVTFIDNHDTSRAGNPYGQPQVERFKNQAYAYILMREHGVPTVYARDYDEFGMNGTLDKMIEVRRNFAYGPGHEASNNDHDVYSYVREGLAEAPGTGLVMMISDGTSGDQAVKNINARQANRTYYDYTGNISGTVTTDDWGYGDFRVNMSENNGWSIWVPAAE